MAYYPTILAMFRNLAHHLHECQPPRNAPATLVNNSRDRLLGYSCNGRCGGLFFESIFDETGLPQVLSELLSDYGSQQQIPEVLRNTPFLSALGPADAPLPLDQARADTRFTVEVLPPASGLLDEIRLRTPPFDHLGVAPNGLLHVGWSGQARIDIRYGEETIKAVLRLRGEGFLSLELRLRGEGAYSTGDPPTTRQVLVDMIAGAVRRLPVSPMVPGPSAPVRRRFGATDYVQALDRAIGRDHDDVDTIEVHPLDARFLARTTSRFEPETDRWLLRTRHFGRWYSSPGSDHYRLVMVNELVPRGAVVLRGRGARTIISLGLPRSPDVRNLTLPGAPIPLPESASGVGPEDQDLIRLLGPDAPERNPFADAGRSLLEWARPGRADEVLDVTPPEEDDSEPPSGAASRFDREPLV